MSVNSEIIVAAAMCIPPAALAILKSSGVFSAQPHAFRHPCSFTTSAAPVYDLYICQCSQLANCTVAILQQPDNGARFVGPVTHAAGSRAAKMNSRNTICSDADTWSNRLPQALLECSAFASWNRGVSQRSGAGAGAASPSCQQRGPDFGRSGCSGR